MTRNHVLLRERRRRARRRKLDGIPVKEVLKGIIAFARSIQPNPYRAVRQLERLLGRPVR